MRRRHREHRRNRVKHALLPPLAAMSAATAPLLARVRGSCVCAQPLRMTLFLQERIWSLESSCQENAVLGQWWEASWSL